MKHIPSDFVTLGMVATVLVIAIIREVILIMKGKISMNDRDCESCKKFVRNDFHESEGYCQAKRTWVDPQEGEDCKMHEFTLHSATKYNDGTPIMSEPEKTYCETDSALIHGETDTYATRKAAKNSVYGKTVEDVSNQLDYLERAFKGFAKTQDDLIEEYDTTLATHAGKINNHTDALLDHEHKLSTLSEDVSINEGNIDSLCSDIEDLQRKVYQIYQFLNSIDPDFFAKIQDEKFIHKGSDFCGNCTHAESKDGICTCRLNRGVTDPDASSCEWFEPPF